MPRKSSSGCTFAAPMRAKNGRRMLSMLPMTTTPTTPRMIASFVRPASPSSSASGAQTSELPTVGMSDATTVSTPSSSALGRPRMTLGERSAGRHEAVGDARGGASSSAASGSGVVSLQRSDELLDGGLGAPPAGRPTELHRDAYDGDREQHHRGDDDDDEEGGGHGGDVVTIADALRDAGAQVGREPGEPRGHHDGREELQHGEGGQRAEGDHEDGERAKLLARGAAGGRGRGVGVGHGARHMEPERGIGHRSTDARVRGYTRGR